MNLIDLRGLVSFHFPNDLRVSSDKSVRRTNNKKEKNLHLFHIMKNQT